MSGVDFPRARVVVELGVGTGCVTRALLERMRPDARLISLEINPAFVAEARRDIADPRLTVMEACATALPAILAAEGIGRVDAVVSSLPLSIMDDDAVDRILDAARDALAPGGRFMQYQYSLAQAHRFSERFDDVAVDFTPLNIPPTFVYECTVASPAPATATRRLRGPASFGSAYAALLAAVALAVRTFPWV